jgi:hypothetical protein
MRHAHAMTLAFCLALGFAGRRAAASEDYPQVWLNPGFLSYHADREADFRENNIGFGAEAVLAPDWGLYAGNFINSQNLRSRYAMVQWRPLHWQPYGVDISAGLIAGAVDGYPDNSDGGWYYGALPMLFLEGKRFGLNVTLVPGRTEGGRLVAIQLKIRVW